MKSVLVLRHEPSVSMGSLAGALAGRAGGAAVRSLRVGPRSLPWSEAAGLVVLGGTMSANDGDRFPFLAAELDWLRAAVRGKCRFWASAWERNSWPRPWGPPSIAMLAGNRLVRDRVLARRGGRSAVSRTIGRGNRLPLARRHLRPSGRRSPPGTKPRVPAAGVSLRCEGLRLAVPRGNGARVDGTLAAGVRRRRRLPRRRASIPRPFARPRTQAFPAMTSFSQCLLARFAAMCNCERHGRQIEPSASAESFQTRLAEPFPRRRYEVASH